ncbi:hypothetical protein OAG34_00910 [bacterium]|nr:hypothetical protein [bacterium]
MRKLKLYPVRELETDNFQQKWRRRTQILGSILYWAHEAGACRIEFDPSFKEPFAFFTPDGKAVTTEMGETPSEYVPSMAQFIRDTIDGTPAARKIRRIVRLITRNSLTAEIEIPPSGEYGGSIWYCTMNGDVATFLKRSDSAAPKSAG